MDRDSVISAYFEAWLNQDGTRLKEFFDEQAVYCESYGPEYRGLVQIEQWFHDWNQCGAVLKWEIKRMLHQGALTVAEWYFLCEHQGETSGFDGVSIVEFNDRGKILKLEEYQSKAEHCVPYGQK